MSNLLLRELSLAGHRCPIITADHQDYDRYRKIWNGVADRRPAAIVRPQSVDDVRKAVHAAAASRALLAVRGGGHSLAGDSEIYVLQLGGAVADVADEATAYTGRGASYYWLAEPVWDEAADDDRCIAWGRITGKSLSTFSMAGNYVNEQADAGTVVALDAYGPEKYQRLARLKTRLDPHNMFRLNQNITPLA